MPHRRRDVPAQRYDIRLHADFCDTLIFIRQGPAQSFLNFIALVNLPGILTKAKKITGPRHRAGALRGGFVIN
jgi:hypothetical protein